MAGIAAVILLAAIVIIVLVIVRPRILENSGRMEVTKK